MRFRIWMLATMIFVVLLTGCFRKDIRKETIDPAALKKSVIIESTKLTIFGEQFTRPFTVGELQSIFGRHNSFYRLISDIYVWDELGVYAHVEKNHPWVSELSLSFRKQDLTFSPNHPYQGYVVIEDNVFSKSSKKKTFKKIGFRYHREINRFERRFGFFYVIVEMSDWNSDILDLTIGMKDWDL